MPTAIYMNAPPEDPESQGSMRVLVADSFDQVIEKVLPVRELPVKEFRKTQMFTRHGGDRSLLRTDYIYRIDENVSA